MSDSDLARTPLFALHRELGARMVPFAGHAMPVSYADGILAEHRHTRSAASLFDVSHMGQIRLTARHGGSTAAAAAALERLVPADIVNLAPGRLRYTQFTGDDGGILDDLIVAAVGDHLHLVVNASRRNEDLAHLRAHLARDCEIEALPARAMIALQGPAAVGAFARHVPDVHALAFMQAAIWEHDGHRLLVMRSGYTGEDGLEISIPGAAAETLARRLLARPEVKPAGLGARDSLRLEAGLCLHGHDIDAATTPVEAGLAWSIPRRRRDRGGFPGARRLLRQLAEGPDRSRVGLRPEGRAPVREGAPIRSADGRGVGHVTSGGFGASVGGPVAMGYVRGDLAVPGSRLELELRGRTVAAEVVRLPFVPHRYHRGRV